jgi:glycosyltransferase involved in cell wall biosynthesis
MPGVCIFIPRLKIGGAEKQSLLLASVLKDHYDTHLMVFDGSGAEKKYLDYIQQHDIAVHFLHGSPGQRIVQFHKFLKENNIQALFTYLAKCNFIGALVGRWAGLPFIGGGIRSSVLEPNKRRVQRILHNHLFDCTVINNYQGVENLVRYGYKRNKFHVIPNCLDLDHSHIVREPAETVSILSVGRFVPLKDYHTALRAISRLFHSKQYEGFRFRYTIVGYGKLQQQIMEWIDTLKISSVVEVVINPPNLTDYYQSSHIYLSTSIFEGLSNGIIEALSYSLPAVVTNVGDNNRLVFEGKNGFLAKVADDGALAGHLYQLRDPALRNEFGSFSYELVKREYSPEKYRSSYLNLLAQFHIDNQTKENEAQ